MSEATIDLSVPPAGSARTEDVRRNFAIILAEMSALRSQLDELSRAVADSPIADAVRRGDLAGVAFTGRYAQLIGAPFVPKAPEDISAVAKRGDVMLGPLELAEMPVEAMHAAPRQYVDDLGTAIRSEIPTDLAELANGPGYLVAITPDHIEAALGYVPPYFDGRYSSLTGKPALGTAAAQNVEAFASATQGATADSAVQPGDLASVAFSGNFSDMGGAVTESQLSSAVAAKLNNTLPYKVDATRAPVATDDSAAGWVVGSTWVDTVGDEAYRCLDATVGAAKWVKTTLSADELATVAFSGNYADLIGKPDVAGAAPVQSVAGKTGNVTLGPPDVGAAPAAHVGSGGTSHANATTSTAGFLSSTDKSKLDGIQAGAQVNAVASVAGKTGAVTLSPSDVGAAPAVHVHSDATTAAAGFMSAADKSKLNGIAAGANAYTHPATHPATIVVEDATHRFVTDAEKANWNAKPGTAVATTTTDGLMSSSDKTKLDSVAAGANAYVHPSSHPATIITEDATHRFVTDTEKTTWNGKASTAVATTTANGLMASTDKSKLDGVQAGANAYVHPTGDGSTHVPANGTTNANKALKAGATAGSYVWGWVDWVELTGKPTTLSGFGITDAASSSHVGATGGAHGVATTAVAGFMSAADKAKLDGVATGATNYSHPTGDGNLHVPANGATSANKVLRATGVAGSYAWGSVDWSELTGRPSTFAPPIATSSVLGGVKQGSNVTIDVSGAISVAAPYSHPTGDGNQHVPATGTTNSGKVLKAGATAGSAAWGSVLWAEIGSKPTTLSGFGITDAAPSSHVGSTGTAHGVATSAVAGFMSAADKQKLDGLGATVSAVLPPVNQGPAQGATGTLKEPMLSASAFASVGLADRHSASQWQVATDANFTNIVYDSGETS